MIKSFEFWTSIEPDLTRETYDLIVSKLQHIDSYIRDYSGEVEFGLDEILGDLELDSTTSYFFPTSNRSFTPWLLHSSLTFEIKTGSISDELRQRIELLFDAIDLDNFSGDVKKTAKIIVFCLEKLADPHNGSSDLFLLYAIDVGLIRLINIAVQLRLKGFMRGKSELPEQGS